MADRKITLFELHFDGDTRFGPTIGEEATEEGGEDESDEAVTDLDVDVEGGAPNPVAGLLALGLLVGIALGIRRLMGGDEEADEIAGEPIDEIETA